MPASVGITPEMARAERARRELARRRFLRFCAFVDPKYPVEARHIQFLAEKLEQVAEYIETRGERGIGRLMIFMPPRYYKSNTASQKFPAWLLGRNPDKRIILTSYGADLAVEHSKAVRDVIGSTDYQAVFGRLSVYEQPVEMSAESRSAARWSLNGAYGGMVAAGVGGAIVGKGGHLMIMDDPLKNREEAESAARREGLKKFYRSAFYTRLEDGGAIVVILTRWDVEDIAGALLTEMVSVDKADKWDVVFLPAVGLEEKAYPKTEAEFRENLLRGIFVPMGGDQLGRAAGEVLWDEKHKAADLETVQANIGDFEFAAQYQQMPRLAEGEFFDDRDFNIIDKAPEKLVWYRYIDLALGESETSDSNVTAAVALDDKGNLYIRDRLKVQQLEAFLPDCRSLMLSEQERGTLWGVEDVAFQILVFKEFLKDRALVNIPISAVKPEGDKVSRARAWRYRAKQGKVFLVRGEWNLDFIRMAAAFPKGRHDDDIDSVSGGVQMIAEGTGGSGRTVVSSVSIAEFTGR